MGVREVTIRLPEEVYAQIERAAAHIQRPVEAVISETVIATAPNGEPVDEHLRDDLARIAYLNDAALWRAAQATMLPEQRERLETLHAIQQQRPLVDPETAEELALTDLYLGTILVRAQAAVLLQQRGYDVADPEQFAPLI